VNDVSTQVVDVSVSSNSPSCDCNLPSNQIPTKYGASGFRPFPINFVYLLSSVIFLEYKYGSFKRDQLDIKFAFFRFTFYVISSDIVRFSPFHFIVSLEEDKSMTFSSPGCVPEDVTTIIHRQTPDRYSAEV